MVKLHSNAFNKEFTCPDFSLKSVDGKVYHKEDFAKSKGLLVCFICNHCPYVQAIESRLIELRKTFSLDDLAIVGICSNDAQSFPEDAPENLYKTWQEKNYGFPYLVDDSQDVAKAFGAVCTPDLFLFDGGRRLYYHGAIDDSPHDKNQVKTQYLVEAVKLLLKEAPPLKEQVPSMGCSIKWL